MTLDGWSQVQQRTWREPFTLSDGPHLFTDWRHVRSGALLWRDDAGEPVPLRGPGPMIEARAVPWDVPSGVSISARPAEIGSALDVQAGTVIYEDGLYRLWYYAPMEGDRPGDAGRALAYAESDDGREWRCPDLGLIDGGPGGAGNIVFGGPLTAATGFHGGGVFLDPSAPDEERYKLIFTGTMHGEDARRAIEHFRQKRPGDIDPHAVRDESSDAAAGVFGATSPDGLRWNCIHEPLILHFSDTRNTGYFDTALNKYVWYGRLNCWYGRRCVGRSESDDFRWFPRPDIVLRPEVSDPPYVDWYTNAKTLYPGTTEEHLMFPAQYSRADENGRIHLFASPDGIHWDEVPGGPVVAHAPGTGSSGRWIVACENLVPLPDDRVGLMCTAAALPHKYPRREGLPPETAFWATWPTGRLSAIEARECGSFATQQYLARGRKLVLNVQTERAGELRVEVAQPRPGGMARFSKSFCEAVPGRTFEDCDPICADSLAHTVTWRGESDLGHAEGSAVALRFRMRATRLFTFQIE